MTAMKPNATSNKSSHASPQHLTCQSNGYHKSAATCNPEKKLISK